MPKNIVLLSDGTGNSSGKLLKTNVWRVYESLDLDDPNEQVACYDDGVGSSSFKPLALLGGAFGVGLMRNVLRLYRFLCEHYDPGDRIYAFGFSRGAFTIRVLIGLVCSQGIIRTRPTSPVVEAYPEGDPDAAASAAYAIGTSATRVRAEPQVFGRELVRVSRWAYREFRRQEFNQTGALVTLARNLRDAVLRWREAGKPRYDASRNHQVEEIAFVGLWDTVDAYGLPVDELTDGINHWIWPLSAPDLRLSDKVQKARHVLALDDERNTFHPVLWDESNEPGNASSTHLDDERISQVWFAGMHANVGGGHPDDALSYMSLRWMTSEAAKYGLRFTATLLEHHTAKADPFGRIYDSRTGLKGYYRYNPRKIEWLTNGQVHESGFGGWPTPSPMVTIARPKIHESVLARIAAAPEAYAPITFPHRYAIVRENGCIIEGEHNPYESDDVRQLRVAAQERLWNLVWWRRTLYFGTVAVSLVLLAQPFRVAALPPASPTDYTAVSRLIALAGDSVGLLAKPWATYYSARPVELAVLIGGILLLMRISSRVQSSIRDGMRRIWSQVIPPPGRDLDRLRPPSDRLFRLRSHPYYQGAFAVLRRIVLPNVFGLATLAVLALWTLGAVTRTLFEAAQVAGFVCPPSTATTPAPVPVGGSTRIVWPTQATCFATAVRIEKDARYRVAVTPLGPNVWRDGDIVVRSPAGFNSLSPGLSPVRRVLLAAFAPFRRLWQAGWFVPVARVGRRGLDQYPLAATTNDFTARSSGELFLFVNDAIAPIGFDPPGVGWDSYYINNDGVVSITIERLREPPGR